MDNAFSKWVKILDLIQDEATLKSLVEIETKEGDWDGQKGKEQDGEEKQSGVGGRDGRKNGLVEIEYNKSVGEVAWKEKKETRVWSLSTTGVKENTVFSGSC